MKFNRLRNNSLLLEKASVPHKGTKEGNTLKVLPRKSRRFKWIHAAPPGGGYPLAGGRQLISSSPSVSRKGSVVITRFRSPDLNLR